MHSIAVLQSTCNQLALNLQSTCTSLQDRGDPVIIEILNKVGRGGPSSHALGAISCSKAGPKLTDDASVVSVVNKDEEELEEEDA